MDILIFTIGFVIFITYMFFLLRMVNRAHNSQEKAQDKYKRQIKPTPMSAHEKRWLKESWIKENSQAERFQSFRGKGENK